MPKNYTTEDLDRILTEHIVTFELSVQEAAYIAGFVDGEGCVTILKNTTDKRCNRRFLIYTIYVIVPNTDLRPLQYIKDLCGEQILFTKHNGSDKGHLIHR